MAYTSITGTDADEFAAIVLVRVGWRFKAAGGGEGREREREGEREGASERSSDSPLFRNQRGREQVRGAPTLHFFGIVS
jgi:hypothetical protein